jgi:hypothetical protein
MTEYPTIRGAGAVDNDAVDNIGVDSSCCSCGEDSDDDDDDRGNVNNVEVVEGSSLSAVWLWLPELWPLIVLFVPMPGSAPVPVPAPAAL